MKIAFLNLYSHFAWPLGVYAKDHNIDIFMHDCNFENNPWFKSLSASGTCMFIKLVCCIQPNLCKMPK
jgi:hypothetical protein